MSALASFLLSAIVVGAWIWIVLTVATKGRPYWPEIRALLRGRRP